MGTAGYQAKYLPAADKSAIKQRNVSFVRHFLAFITNM